MLLRRLMTEALRRAAADPRVRAKAAEVVETEVRPRAVEAARKGRGALDQAKAEWRDVVEEADPEDSTVRLAGRFTGRLRRRLFDDDREEE
jgi:hypothetical protein